MRRPVWWMLVLVGCFLYTLVFIVYLIIWGPSQIRGVVATFTDGAMLVQAVPPDSQAAEGGLRVGDRILSVDGRLIRVGGDWTAVTGTWEAGRPHRWEIARGAERVILEITPGYASVRGRLSEGYHGYSLHLLSGLLLGLLIAWKRPADPVARLGAWFLMTTSIAFGLPQGWAAPWRELPTLAQLPLWVTQISRFVIEGIFLSFFLVFPRRLIKARWPWFVLWIPVLATLPWRIAGFDSIIHPRPGASVPAWILQAGFVRTVVYLLTGAAVLVVSYFRILDPNEKRRVRVLMLGTALSATSATGMVVLDSFYSRSSSFFAFAYLLLPFNSLGVVSLAYATLRHRVLDIRVIVRQSLQYALVRGFVLGLVPALAGLLVLDLAINSQEPLARIMQSRGWIYIGLAAAALAIHWKRQRWLGAIDRRFFRERYDAHRVLRDVVEDIRTARDLERVATRVVTQIETALHPEFVSLMKQEPDDLHFRVLAVAPAAATANTPAALAAGSKLIGLVQLLGKPLDVQVSTSAWLERRLPPSEIDFVRQQRIDLLVPITGVPGGRQALLILGVKRSEEPYTRDDQELLETIASSLALLLDKQAAAVTRSTQVFNECPECGACYDASAQTCTHEHSQLLAVRLPRILAGRYRLERRRGRGGMGTVYEAVDRSLDRRVAVKVIREDLLDSADAAERFQREARASAAFSHPHVVTVHDFGLENTRAFLVMELLEGATLREELNRLKTLDAARVLPILRDTCSAIDAAHQRQLIHRDVKPENIFLTAAGAKVLDFGIAKFLPGHNDDAVTHVTAQTRTGFIVGTIAYMSPEQLLGGSPEVSWDLWAVAVVAYEALMGTLPFPNVSTVDWRRAILNGAFIPTERWDTFFNLSFAANPAERPQSASELFRLLEQTL